MTVTIDLDEHTRLHITGMMATIVLHADGVPNRVEEYMLKEFIQRLRAMRPEAPHA